MLEEKILVSIICNAYNHEDYIKDALEGFLKQKTNFAFEVLVHDDASTDKTADIIREYESKYPKIIKPIYQKENQYSQKIHIGPTYQFPRAKGKYIAFCEGDDYWTDSYKLQRQFDALEEHPEVDICAHTANRVNAQTKETISLIKPSQEDVIFTAEEVIAGGGGFVATNSLMCRVELVKNVPEFRRFLMLDYTLQIQGALRGGMLYLKDNMSSYRVMAKGSWTSNILKDKERNIIHMQKINKMLEILNKDTAFVYEGTIKERMKSYNFLIFMLNCEYKKLLLPEYKKQFQKLNIKERIKIRLKAHFPFLIKEKNK